MTQQTMTPSHTLRQDAKTISLVGLAHACSHFSHMLLAPLYVMFMKEFNLSYSQIGLLVSVFFVISGVGQASSGFLVDRVGARPVLYGSLALFVLASLAAATAQGYSGLMLCMVLAGLGNSPFHPVDFSIMNQRVSASRLGYAFSLHGVCGNLGWAAAIATITGLTALLGDWRQTYFAVAAMFACVLVLMVVNREYLHTEQVAKPTATLQAKPSDFAFLKLPAVWLCFAFFFTTTMTLAMVQSFASSVLDKVHGVSFESANLVVTAYMVSAAIGMLIGGVVAAKSPMKSDAVVMRAMGAGAVLMFLCATGWLGTVLTCILLAATGFVVGIGGPSRDLMIKGATPKGATGRVYGLVYSGMDIGFALAPLILGAMMDKGWYSAVIAFGGGSLVLGVVLARGVGKISK